MMATAAVPATIQPSKLFASLFEGHDPERRLTVVDVGLGLPESLDFFSAYRCRLHYIDLFAEPILRSLDGAAADDLPDEAQLEQQFVSLLQFPPGTQIDICLFWDFFNYLNPMMLRAFSAALKPWLHPGTRGHAFGVHNERTVLPYCEYGVQSLDELTSRPREGQQSHCYPHGQAALGRNLSGFAVRRAVLLSDGRLEIVLGAELAR
jgi:hypothetical protein